MVTNSCSFYFCLKYTCIYTNKDLKGLVSICDCHRYTNYSSLFMEDSGFIGLIYIKRIYDELVGYCNIVMLTTCVILNDTSLGIKVIL